MKIMETHGCSYLNSSVVTYQLYCLVMDKASLTLITATLMRIFTFTKMNSDLIVYGGADPAPQDKRIADLLVGQMEATLEGQDVNVCIRTSKVPGSELKCWPDSLADDYIHRPLQKKLKTFVL
jgi:hypothetical protein